MTKEQRNMYKNMLYAFYGSGDTCVEMAENWSDDITEESDPVLFEAFKQLNEGACALNARLEELDAELETNHNIA